MGDDIIMCKYRNTMICEHIDEEVRQKFEFGIVGSMNKLDLRKSRCSGIEKCNFSNADSCDIIKTQLDKRTKQKQDAVLENKKEEEKWNF